MKDWGNWALRNRKLLYFVIVVLVIGGALAFYNMSKLEDPEIKVKQALVVTTYPGASAHQVELEVTDVLEKSIRSMKDVDNISSRSMNDVSIISVKLSTLVKNKDVEQHWDILRRKVGDIQNRLPEGAGKSEVRDGFGDMYGIFYAMTADGFSDREAGEYAELIKREIQTIEGVSDIIIYGRRKTCINIELHEDRMATLGVHPAEVLTTLNGQNKTVYSGYYESDGYRLRVSVNDKYKTVTDIENLLLQGHENDQLRLRDIARVTEDYENPTYNEMRYDREKALGIAISATSGTDITKIGKQAENKLTYLKENRLPAGIAVNKVFYQPERVNDALGSFMINLIESILIVIGVLMLTMGFRSGVIIGTSLFIVVAGSFFVLNMFDGTLQRVSLAAFILAMGMLVDNAIVIVDGILVDMKQRKSRRTSLTSIGRKTAMPLLAATVIAILAFLPLYLSPDTAGVYVHDLFIVLAVSLLLSWLLALTQVPLQANAMLPVRPKNKNKDKNPFDSKAYRMLNNVLSWLLRHKLLSIGVAVVLVAVSAFCFRFMPQGFFPDMDYDQLYIEYKLPEGSSSTKVKADLETIENYLLSRKDIKHVTTSIGGTPARYNLVRSIADPSLSYGELIVDFNSPKELVENMKEIQDYLTTSYPDAYVRLKRYNLMYKKYPIELQFNGPDPAVLRKLTAQAEDIMRRSDKIFLVNSDWEPKTPTLMVDYNQPIARNIGLSRQDVALSLLSATGGIPTSVFYDGNYRQTIYLKSVDKNNEPIESLENISVFSMMPSLGGLNKQTIQGVMTGAISKEELLESTLRTVPLSQASNGVKLVWEDPIVIRDNGQRAMRAQCNPAFGVSAEDARQSIIKEINKISLPEGYTMQWEGEFKASLKSKKYLFRTLPLAIILMVIILIMLFKDYKKPLIIFCCIPLIMVGVIAAMLLSGKTFGFVAIVGMLGLIGMMVKNGIVLMDEITLQIASGMEPTKALLDSAAMRFRPVMMASLTTILGMIPLLSDGLFGSCAATIMGGLLFGTIITLLFIPVLYAVFFQIKTSPNPQREKKDKNKKIPFGGLGAFLVFVLLCGNANAQQTMTLEKCRELALQNNRAAAIAGRNKDQTEYTQRAYRANYFPKISASGNYNYTSSGKSLTIPGGYLPTFVPDPATGQLVPNILTVNPDGSTVFKEYAYFPDMDLSLKLSGTWMAGVSVEQPIYTGGKITSAHRMAQISNEIAGLNKELTRAEIIVKTDEAYWTYVQTNELLKLALSYQRVVTELLRNVQDAQEVGLKHRNDVLKVQVKVNEAELQVRQAENGVRLSRKNLCHVMGITLDSEVVLPESFDEPLSANIDRAAGYTNRPEYAMLEKQIQLKEQQGLFTQSDFLPQVGVMANYRYINGVQLNGNKLFDKASFSAMLSVRVPLFHWGEGRNKVRAAKAERDIAQLQCDNIGEQMELELAKASDKCDESEFEVRLTARSVEQAQENMKVSGDQYTTGMETLANFLEAQTVWQRAWMENINAITRQRFNQTYYLKAAGKL